MIECGKLPATWALFAALGPVHPCTIKPFLSSFLSWRHSREKRYQALARFSVLIAMESWVGPGNEASILWWQKFLRGFPRKHSNVSHIRKSKSSQSRSQLAVSTEWVSSQTNKSCSCKSISPFTMGLYGSLYDYVIHTVLLATSHASLITSCQPPLG